MTGRFLALLCAGTTVVSTPSYAAPAPPAAPPPAATPAASPGAQRTPGGATYTLELSSDVTGAHWHGTQHIRFTNTAGSALDRVWLRLWGNGIGGCAQTEPVRVTRVSGGTAGPLAVDCTALPVDLPAPLPPGASTALSFELTIDVPRRTQRFGRVGDFSYLGNAVPVLAVRGAGGWHLPPYVPEGGSFGESFFSLTADWDVTLHHPSGLQVPATGTVLDARTDGGRTTTVLRASRVRDFALAAGPFRQVRSTTPDGVTVRGWTTPEVADGRALEVTGTVARAVDRFATRYGAYPYDELDVVISGAFAEFGGGMEYPQLVLTEPTGSVAVHETAHQWWYGLAGNDQYRHPWLDESVTQYVTDAFLGRQRSCDPYRWPSPTARVDAGMAYFADRPAEYVPTVYGQGPCMLHDLRAVLGTDRMRTALRAVLTQNRYGVVEPARFRRVMQHHSPVDLTSLWRRWRNDRH